MVCNTCADGASWRELFATSALAAFSASVATSADAWVARFHASACYTQGGIPLDINFIIQNESLSPMAMLCPAHEQTGQLKSASTQVAFVVSDGSTTSSVQVFACSAFIVQGGTCGPGVSSGSSASFTGDFILNVPNIWAQGLFSEYGYAALLHQTTQLNCTRQVVLPEPARRDSVYQATVLYDCAGQRGR